MTGTFKKSSPGIGYGLTETNALGAVNAGAFYRANPNSTGRVVPAVTEFRVEDEDGRSCRWASGVSCVSSPRPTFWATGISRRPPPKLL